MTSLEGYEHDGAEFRRRRLGGLSYGPWVTVTYPGSPSGRARIGHAVRSTASDMLSPTTVT